MSSPAFPKPPALPSFDLASFDLAATSERPAARPVDKRIVPKRNPDSTSEVSPEDILLEVLTDAPLLVRPAPTPTKQQLADLDRLLKMSVRPIAQPLPADQETPSVAPVVYSNPSFVSFPSIQASSTELGPSYQTDLSAPKRAGTVGLLLAAALLVLGALVGLVIVKAPLPTQQAHILSTGAWPAVRYTTTPLTTTQPGTPVVSVSSLPTQEIASTTTLVSLPPRATGHRVWVDGAVVSTGGASVTVKCGRHNVKIGGKVSRVNLPCGEAYAIK